jgi:tetratricopeptide (TPR) repeat protein
MNAPSLASAMTDYRAGRFEAAAAGSRNALATSPGDEGLLTLLAMAEHAAGNHAAAADAFAQLARLRPGVAEYWANLGYMLRLCRRGVESEEAFKRSLALNPHAYSTLTNYGLLLLDLSRFGAARDAFLRAVELEPELPDARIYGSTTSFECGDARTAAKLVPPRETWASLTPDLRRDLSIALAHVGRTEEAESLLREDVERLSDPETIAHLAMLYERTNKVDKASEQFERLRPHLDSEADRDLRLHALTVDVALALRAKQHARARAAVEALLGLQPAASIEANARFTLAAIADKEGKPDEAMRCLEQAHAFQFRQAVEIAPDIALSDEEPLRIAMQLMTEDECRFVREPHGPAADRSPVFIVGFPRSGTTMLEQMLDAHPRHVAMDEQLTLQHCIQRMQSMGFSYPRQLAELGDADVQRIRDAYWEEAARVVDVPRGMTLVDKNPLNLLRLPMIARIFPSAKIILALRHPCDVMLSCYMQNFRSPAFMTLCSSLERLARSYAHSMESWIHHQRLLQPDLLVLRYEDTVSRFGEQARRIADFLGIEDAGLLEDFSSNAAGKPYISTPSYAQVVEPVNARAVARWHAYREYFEPVFPIVRPIAEHWGYDLSAG